MSDTATESNLVKHARRELELIGQFAEDEAFAQSIVDAVAAFAAYGHSGGSASVAIEMLHRLLRFQHLAPITSDPSEWIDQSAASGTPLWQSKRNPAIFSEDGGATWYDLDAPPTGEQ